LIRGDNYPDTGGNDKAGYKHVLDEHIKNFEEKGVRSAALPKLIMNTLVANEIVGYQGKSKGRPIYRSRFFLPKNDAVFVDIAITVGSNGFIVGANPTSKLKK
jgi:hypothetical protein